MRRLFLILTAFIILFVLPSPISARSGCCSHHGGVCGCGCCDGGPLSSTCAPYYPECSRPVYVAPVATIAPTKAPTPKPTLAPTIKPTPISTPTLKPTPTPIPQIEGVSTQDSPTPTATPESSNKNSNAFGWIILIVVAGISFLIYKRVNKQKSEIT